MFSGHFYIYRSVKYPNKKPTDNEVNLYYRSRRLIVLGILESAAYCKHIQLPLVLLYLNSIQYTTVNSFIVITFMLAQNDRSKRRTLYLRNNKEKEDIFLIQWLKNV